MTLLVGSIFHMTRKIVSEMTYNVSMGTLNPTIPYLLPCGAGTTCFHVVNGVICSTNVCILSEQRSVTVLYANILAKTVYCRHFVSHFSSFILSVCRACVSRHHSIADEIAKTL